MGRAALKRDAVPASRTAALRRRGRPERWGSAILVSLVIHSAFTVWAARVLDGPRATQAVEVFVAESLAAPRVSRVTRAVRPHAAAARPATRARADRGSAPIAAPPRVAAATAAVAPATSSASAPSSPVTAPPAVTAAKQETTPASTPVDDDGPLTATGVTLLAQPDHQQAATASLEPIAATQVGAASNGEIPRSDSPSASVAILGDSVASLGEVAREPVPALVLPMSEPAALVPTPLVQIADPVVPRPSPIVAMPDPIAPIPARVDPTPAPAVAIAQPVAPTFVAPAIAPPPAAPARITPPTIAPPPVAAPPEPMAPRLAAADQRAPAPARNEPEPRGPADYRVVPALRIVSPRDGHRLTADEGAVVTVEAELTGIQATRGWLIANDLRIPVAITSGRVRQAVPILEPAVKLRFEVGPDSTRQKSETVTVFSPVTSASGGVLVVAWGDEAPDDCDLQATAMWRAGADTPETPGKPLALKLLDSGAAHPPAVSYYTARLASGVYAFVLSYRLGQDRASTITPTLYAVNDSGRITATRLPSVSLSGTGKVTLARILMPYGVTWNRDEWFTGQTESLDTITKFRFPEGIAWTERKEDLP